MKRTLLLLLLLVLGVTGTAYAGQRNYDGYFITREKYRGLSDYKQQIKNKYGPDARVADWNEIKRKYGHNLRTFLDGIGLGYKKNAFVTRNGNTRYSGSRAFFITRHEHNKPGSYLAHDQMDSYYLSLGSWDTTQPVLVYMPRNHGPRTQDSNRPHRTRVYDGYFITQEKYRGLSDYERQIKQKYGPNARVADWNEIKRKYGHNLRRFLDGIGLEYKKNAFVTRNGNTRYSGSRAFFITRHEHNKPGSYLAHDQMDSYYLSLGSWDTTQPVLVYIGSQGPRAQKSNRPHRTRTYDGYFITQEKYRGLSDYERQIKQKYGPNARVADWNEIKRKYGHNLRRFLDGIGLEYKKNAFVTRNGNTRYSGSRAFFITRHEHNKPGSYLAHDQMDSYYLSLGSWDTTQPVLVYIGSQGPRAQKSNRPHRTRVYDGYFITQEKYRGLSDYERQIKQKYGPNARVADWNEIKRKYGHNLRRFLDGIGLKYKKNAFVTRNGNTRYSGSRAFFITRHEHNKPGSYLAHDQMDSYYLSLGSWDTTQPVLVYMPRNE